MMAEGNVNLNYLTSIAKHVIYCAARPQQETFLAVCAMRTKLTREQILAKVKELRGA